MSIIKLNNIHYTEIDTDKLVAVSTDIRECISEDAKYLCFRESLWSEEMSTIDCICKNNVHIVLQYDKQDLSSYNDDLTRLLKVVQEQQGVEV